MTRDEYNEKILAIEAQIAAKNAKVLELQQTLIDPIQLEVKDLLMEHTRLRHVFYAQERKEIRKESPKLAKSLRRMGFDT